MAAGAEVLGRMLSRRLVAAPDVAACLADAEMHPIVPARGRALDAGAGCLAVDQRGLARPQGPACDIGAFELDYVPPKTTITFGPGRFLRSTTAQVSFKSSENCGPGERGRSISDPSHAT